MSNTTFEYRDRAVVIGDEFVSIDGDTSSRTYGRLQAEVEFIQQLINAEEGK